VFRKALPGDGTLIAKLRQTIWQSTYRGIYPDAMMDCFDFDWHIQRDEARIADPHTEVFLIEVENLPVGYLVYGVQTPCVYKDFALYLHSLYLLPAYQRRGIGRLAVEKVRAYGRQLGLKKFYNQCQPQNAGAMAFYRQMGGRIGYESLGNENIAEDTVCFEYEIE